MPGLALQSAKSEDFCSNSDAAHLTLARDVRTRQTYYFPGLRAEKEVTRERIARYIEQVFGEKMAPAERKRFLPVEEEEEEEVEA